MVPFKYGLLFLMYTGVGAFLAGIAKKGPGFDAFMIIFFWPLLLYWATIKDFGRDVANKAEAIKLKHQARERAEQATRTDSLR